MANIFVSISDMIANIRDWLGDPDHDLLGDDTVLARLRRKLDHYRNRQDLTDQNWLMARWDLNVDSQNEEAIVTAPAFGRAVNIYTKDPNNPYHVRRYPKICSVQEIELYYDGPLKDVSGIGTYSPWVARAFAFYRNFQTAQPMVRWTPIHSVPCLYTMEYQPSRILPIAMGDNLGMLDQFANLFEVETALDCLIECTTRVIEGKEHIGMQDAEYQRRKVRLQENMVDYRETFQRYILEDKQEKVTRRRVYGDGMDDSARILPASWY